MKQIILLSLIFLSFSARSQMNEEDLALIGIRGGYVYFSTLEDLRNTVVPRDRQPVIWPHTKEVSRNGFFVSVFGHQRIPGWPFATQLELSFAGMGGDLETDVPDTLFKQYAKFQYLYFNPTFTFNWHPLLPGVAKNANAFSGIHLGIGAGYNLILKDKISFSSHQPSEDPPVEEYMNTYLNGKSHFNLFGKLGYEYFWNRGNAGSGFGITFDARIGFGLGDAVESTSFIYEDTEVRAQYILFTAGIVFPLSR